MVNQSNKVLSAQLCVVAERYWIRLCEVWPQAQQQLTQNQQQQLQQVFGLSDYIGEQLCRHPEWIGPLFDGLLTTVNRNDFDNQLQQLLSPVTHEDNVKTVLRLYRNQQMVRLAWRDFMGYSSVEDALLDLSALAEALVIAARDWVYQDMCRQLGTPMDSEGNPQPLLILGMGKLGGRELNFSSDIDLIFTFPEHGETQGGRRALANQQFFIRMGQRLVNVLDQITLDGFVFRVDMRLRPYGESGPLVVSFSGLEDYYQEQGRDWERYAMVKARVLGPWTHYSDELQQLLRPFVYRRYIDFSAIESLRKMKRLIAQEVRRRQLSDNIKLGAGGIREVEFVVQSFQLIRGGREPDLRQQSIFGAVDTLYNLGQLEYLAVDELKHSYVFLRRVENLLQAINDQQTQTLPNNPLDWQRLCYVLDADDEAQLRQKVAAAMAIIHRHFNATVGGDEHHDQQEPWTHVIWDVCDDDDALSLLAEHQVEDERIWLLLKTWRATVLKRAIGPRGRETLDKLMPKLLEEILQLTQPSSAFEPVSMVLDKILTRTTYLELLCENPGARQQLVRLCSASPWIAKELANFPMLLDELIDPAQLYDTTSIDDYPSELRQYLLRVPEDDMEQQMEALRQFKLSQQLKIAAADVTGVLPVMEVSDHLTFLAEAIIEQVVLQAWHQVAERHGVPAQMNVSNMGFAIVGYGKLGGIELGYGSDLDLVFLHDKLPAGCTDGKKPIDSHHFYLKLAQRIIHLFATRTNSGELYEVDMRLRPSGSSGLLVSEIARFGEYQATEAWTWEHQALVRSRFVFGSDALAGQFSQLRAKVLQEPRATDELAKNVREMRLKMREHLLKVDKNSFDLKQSPGGIADIEFIAQFMVLAHSNQQRDLTMWSDNVRIFEALAEFELMEFAEVQLLTQTYCQLRDANHELTLQQKKGVVNIERFAEQTEQIKRIYQHYLASE
ncbi:bifunctional [glutamate--ammonia ligase]-adenylyl-L-tyrosine phosphorylase/[glutamate--ammonia-ligase] adenylyltransferase [Shewanella intestini]|uniref:Bifunctional glutamine synthetase adenylyltransferase/adenylyl-removing enzyme n=2 Tax=Shewanellaceae TaxID=267890 RepID=A0ABS5I153_9GAMM|nr:MULTISPECIES: bifunctional [glutamate--ammonia ligase]-adenylyl-L-tyrosine phosphorylase/[glutamate--ammonia-ligase] adenylyltransferase [Shewanella]MBR9727740.1 bifunctional [glutamate--ammonia ligase]-adenylyl-L-tyrosine phosphorylase/[glutamate--ammonia-ligase] adenylyltransferase [Shewanella intestini]